ncbi:CYFA0S01e14004g1_1 [Cyberlindnera fabianii]|uniref:CYFA0S01e14004g1_1 n=1 Tax=Cyberlindnera fabianii TaxID=36022 RepID=A0A061ASD5_CYBFA|nr:Guanine nucleotide-binding protein subunit beta [Cyberlindnera fabianii]CDR37644.1 CYFA0S01e14004g1_1 [Cyberlindnera fabianii]
MSSLDNDSTAELLTNRVNKARLETRQLYQQIDKVKAKIQDTTLQDCTTNMPAISRGSVNLKPFQILRGHNNKIADFKWGKDSRSILSCSQDGFLIVWDAVTGMKLSAVPLDSQWVLSCAYSPNQRLVASAGLTNNCTVYSLPSMDGDDAFQQRIVNVFKGHVCGITACDFISDNTILTASGDLTCARWDITKGRKVGEYLDHFGDVLCIDIDRNSVNSGDCVFVSGASDGYARVWDTRSPAAAQMFFVSNSDVTAVKFFKDGNSFVTGSDDGLIRLYDLRADCELSRYTLPNNHLHGQPATTPFSAQRSHRPASLEDMNTSVLDASGVNSLDFSSSGRLMYASYADHGCVVWDTLRAEVVDHLEGHSNRVSKVATSPDGFAVCTASWDTTMRVWTPAYA